jgi:hypothetical protein
LAVSLAVAASSFVAYQPAVEQVAAAPPGFVTADGDDLVLDGQPYRFTGMNVYHANNTALCWNPMTDAVLEASLDEIGTGRVIRAWFFQSLATDGGVRDWAAFDRLMAFAASRGMKVIPTLGNQWSDCDGPDGGEGADKDEAWYTTGYKFETQPGSLVPYRDWVAEVVERYADDPTVLMWQLMNEAEVKPVVGDGLPCSTDAAEILRDFASDVSTLVKSNDPDHLVSLGTIGGGQCGTSFEEYAYVHGLATIDVCEYHDYGAPTESFPGDEFNGLQKRIDQCDLLDKPLIIGESGIRPNAVGGSLEARSHAFRSKLTDQVAAGIDGVALWAWSQAGSTINDYDIGPGDPVLAVLADVLAPPGTTVLVSGAIDFDGWSGYPVPAAPTPPDEARYTVYASRVAVDAAGSVFVRDYDTIVKVDPLTGVTQRVAGFYADPLTSPPYPVVPDGIGEDSLTVGTGWSRHLLVLDDGRMLFNNDGPAAPQVFSAPVAGGTIELFAGDGTTGLPASGAQASMTSLDEVNGLFGAAGGAVWILGGYDETYTVQHAHFVAADGTVSTHALPASDALAVSGDELLAIGVDQAPAAAATRPEATVDTQPEVMAATQYEATLHSLDSAGALTSTPITGPCRTLTPTRSAFASDTSLRYIAENQDVSPYELVECVVDLATGISFTTPLDPDLAGWLGGTDDGTIQQRAESPAQWDPVSESWWFIGRSDRTDGRNSLGLYRHGATLPPAPDPTITVGVVTSPAGGAGTVSFAAPFGASLGDGDQTSPVSVPAGTHVVSATPAAGWVISDVICDDADSGPGPSPDTVSFVVDPDEDVFCSVVIDKVLPVMTVADVSFQEPLTGQAVRSFVASIPAPTDAAVTFTARTTNGTAVAGSDYVALASKVFTIPAGAVSVSVPVTLRGDDLDEEDETFNLVLSNPAGATLARTTAVATIIDTDEPPGFSVGDVSVVEGNGTKTVLAVVTLSAKLKASASVRLATTATGTATVGVDYVAKAPTTVTFPAGTVRKTVAITIRGDMVIEPNETFGLVLSSPIGAPIIDGTGVVTIVDDDRAPVLSVQPVSTVEGNSGTRLATFSLRLDRPFGKTVSVKYRTANGTATAGTDYTAKALTTVSFTPGQTTKTVTVTIRGDLVKEPNETYTLQLSAPVNVTLAATQVTGTIVNDD